jgi:hypothetical protein
MRTLLVLAEEGEAEQAARFAAALRPTGASRSEIEPMVRRLIVIDLATLLVTDSASGEVVPAPGWTELRKHIEEFRPDVLMLDPLVELHTADENSNPQLKAVISRFRGLAREFGLAVVLTHHTRKGTVVPGELEQLRGAGAIGGAARFGFTLVEMSREEAETFSISQTPRRYYLRLDRARGSYAPPAAEAEWFEKHGITLDNGDETPALLPWTPPEGRAPDQTAVVRLLSGIASGCPEAGGEPWSPQCRQNSPRSVRQLFLRHGIDRVSEKLALQALRDAGVEEIKYQNAHRDWRLGLRTKHGLPAAPWADAGP